jgi:hypothetical protein
VTVRAEVVSLILDLDMDACRWPGEHPIHLDGSRFTDDEAELVNSSTAEEIASASDALLMANEIDAAELAALDRITALAALDARTGAEQAELVDLADRWGVNLTNGERGAS